MDKVNIKIFFVTVSLSLTLMQSAWGLCLSCPTIVTLIKNSDDALGISEEQAKKLDTESLLDLAMNRAFSGEEETLKERKKIALSQKSELLEFIGREENQHYVSLYSTTRSNTAGMAQFNSALCEIIQPKKGKCPDFFFRFLDPVFRVSNPKTVVSYKINRLKNLEDFEAKVERSASLDGVFVSTNLSLFGGTLPNDHSGESTLKMFASDSTPGGYGIETFFKELDNYPQFKALSDKKKDQYKDYFTRLAHLTVSYHQKLGAHLSQIQVKREHVDKFVALTQKWGAPIIKETDPSQSSGLVCLSEVADSFSLINNKVEQIKEVLKKTDAKHIVGAVPMANPYKEYAYLSLLQGRLAVFPQSFTRAIHDGTIHIKTITTHKVSEDEERKFKEELQLLIEEGRKLFGNDPLLRELSGIN